MQDFCILWLKVYAYFIKTPKILAITDSEAGEVEEIVVISKRFENFDFLNSLVPSLWNSKYVINIFIPLGKKITFFNSIVFGKIYVLSSYINLGNLSLFWWLQK